MDSIQGDSYAQHKISCIVVYFGIGCAGVFGGFDQNAAERFDGGSGAGGGAGFDEKGE